MYQISLRTNWISISEAATIGDKAEQDLIKKLEPDTPTKEDKSKANEALKETLKSETDYPTTPNQPSIQDTKRQPPVYQGKDQVSGDKYEGPILDGVLPKGHPTAQEEHNEINNMARNVRQLSTGEAPSGLEPKAEK